MGQISRCASVGNVSGVLCFASSAISRCKSKATRDQRQQRCHESSLMTFYVSEIHARRAAMFEEQHAQRGRNACLNTERPHEIMVRMPMHTPHTNKVNMIVQTVDGQYNQTLDHTHPPCTPISMLLVRLFRPPLDWTKQFKPRLHQSITSQH